MAEFAWSDGRHLTAAEETVIADLARGVVASTSWKGGAVNHLVALKVAAPADGPLPLRLTGLGRHIAVNYLGLEIADPPTGTADPASGGPFGVTGDPSLNAVARHLTEIPR